MAFRRSLWSACCHVRDYSVSEILPPLANQQVSLQQLPMQLLGQRQRTWLLTAQHTSWDSCSYWFSLSPKLHEGDAERVQVDVTDTVGLHSRWRTLSLGNLPSYEVAASKSAQTLPWKEPFFLLSWSETNPSRWKYTYQRLLAIKHLWKDSLEQKWSRDM